MVKGKHGCIVDGIFHPKDTLLSLRNPQHRLEIVYPSPPSTFQGQDQLDAFAASVKWGAPILSWGRIPEVTRMAFREMWSGRPGPVQLEIPSPVLYETGDGAPFAGTVSGIGAMEEQRFGPREANPFIVGAPSTPVVPFLDGGSDIYGRAVGIDPFVLEGLLEA